MFACLLAKWLGIWGLDPVLGAFSKKCTTKFLMVRGLWEPVYCGLSYIIDLEDETVKGKFLRIIRDAFPGVLSVLLLQYCNIVNTCT